MLHRVAWLLAAVWLVFILFAYPLQEVGVGSQTIAAIFLGASIGMGLLLVLKWSALAKTERWGIMFSVPVWLLLAYFFYQ